MPSHQHCRCALAECIQQSASNRVLVCTGRVHSCVCVVASSVAPNCGYLYRCVRPDQSSVTNRLHYLEDGNVNFAVTINRAEYFIPVVFLLKAFQEVQALSRRQYSLSITPGRPP
jgi:hypothetical protein